MYWVGPLGGAALATFVYKIVFDLPDKRQTREKARENEIEANGGILDVSGKTKHKRYISIKDIFVLNCLFRLADRVCYKISHNALYPGMAQLLSM